MQKLEGIEKDLREKGIEKDYRKIRTLSFHEKRSKLRINALKRIRKESKRIKEKMIT